QLAEHAAAGAVTHACLEAHAIGHVIHRAGFGDDRLAWVEDDFHTLGRLAENFVLKLVTGHGGLLGPEGCDAPTNPAERRDLRSTPLARYLRPRMRRIRRNRLMMSI